MTSPEDRIKEIEEEIRRTPYNKATQGHVGRLKARLAKLREDSAKPKGPQAARGVRKSGDATVAIVGFPSVGKSTLLNRITEARSKVGSYDFTTLRAVPGLLSHRGARIQLLDLPGIARGAAGGRGRGREVLSHVRIADLLVLMIDVAQRDLGILLAELSAAGIRVNEDPPRVLLRRRDRGGIEVSFTVRQRELEEEAIKEVLKEWGIANAELVVRDDLTLDQLVDSLAGNRVYVPGIVVLNKVDLVPGEEVARIVQELGDWVVLPTSAKEGSGLKQLLEAIYSRLSLMRVYLRPPGRNVDTGEPLVVREGARVRDVCTLLHGDFLRNFRHAQVWGPSAKFPGQTVGIDHRLEDGDTVTIVARGG
ncbi:MAG: OBG GTPase family GTP-binding protein [Thermoplasmata archaeon]